MPRKPKPEPFTVERFEQLMMMAAELVDWTTERDGPAAGEQLRPLFDYWKGHYLAARDRGSAVGEVRALLAEKSAT
jgi:hypothetical protein